MIDNMGSFRIDIEIENNAAPGVRRWTGQASIYAAGAWTVDQVIFGMSSDLVLLGSRSLEGLNLRVDPVAKRLTDAGPMPLAISQ